MENFDIREAIPLLKQFGIDPTQLGPEKLEELMRLSQSVKNPSDITPETSRKILDVLGVNIRPPQLPKKVKHTKVGRNQKCSCGSDIKYKFCCGDN